MKIEFDCDGKMYIVPENNQDVMVISCWASKGRELSVDELVRFDNEGNPFYIPRSKSA